MGREKLRVQAISRDLLDKCDVKNEISFNDKQTLSLLGEHDFDSIMLDAKSHGKAIPEIVKLIRDNNHEQPIVLIGQVSDKEIIEQGLINGADAYITHKEDFKIALLTAEAVLRREQKAQKSIIYIDDKIYLNLFQGQFYAGEKSIPLSKTQYKLAKIMTIERNKVLSREKLMSALYGFNYQQNDHVLDAHISFIRKLFEQYSPGFRGLKAVYGRGYILKA